MRVLTETKWGRMLVNDQDKYCGRMLMHWGEFSRGEIECFKYWIKPGMIVADVGANIGAHTLVFARLVGNEGCVFAYEPQRLIHQMLCANLALNGINNVFAYNAAVGARKETVMLNSLDPDVEQNFGGVELRLLADSGNERCRIEPLTMDVDFLKIDAEGMEREVLEGAEAMILRRRPLMFIENEKQARADALLATIRALGYVPYWHITPYFDPANERGAKEEDLFGDKHLMTFNLLCLPEERNEKLNLLVADCGHEEFCERGKRECADSA